MCFSVQTIIKQEPGDRKSQAAFPSGLPTINASIQEIDIL